MASSKEYLDFILDNLSELSNISTRKMMGEYLIYYNGKYVAAVCDNRFLIKDTPSARKLLPDANFEMPYEGAKQMLMPDNVDNKHLLKMLFESVYKELPEPKTKKKKEE